MMLVRGPSAGLATPAEAKEAAAVGGGVEWRDESTPKLTSEELGKPTDESADEARLKRAPPPWAADSYVAEGAAKPSASSLSFSLSPPSTSMSSPLSATK